MPPRHPYRRLRSAKPHLPEVGISEEGNIRSLHLGSDTIQSSMNVGHPSELMLSYSRAMMGRLLSAEAPPKYITQIDLNGDSFVRWVDSYLPDAKQTATDIDPQVIAVAHSLFKLPHEGENFEIIEADGTGYIKVFCHNTDVILVDGFGGGRIIDALMEEPFFRDYRNALFPDGVFVTNWWSGDQRYQRFVERLLNPFDGRMLELPTENHNNATVAAFRSNPEKQNLDNLRRRAGKLSEKYGLDFK